MSNMNRSTVLTSHYLLFCIGLSLLPMIPQYTYSSLFNVAAVGDWGCNDNSKNTLKNISNKKPELILALGDLSYQRTAECWIEIISSVDNITSIVRGDHDNDFRTSQYMEHFNMSSEFYSFNHFNIHFMIMSTELPYELGSKQYEFVKSDLENALTNSSIKWIIIAYHQPAYISPNDCQGCSPRVTLREVYHPLFDRYNVDLVLQAHSHNYERSYPILYNNDDSENPIIVNSSKNNYNYDINKFHGSIFATVGTGGAELHNFELRAPYIATQHRGFGFLNLELTNNGTRLNSTFYDNNGTISDHFIIDKLVSKEGQN
ncbi:MAG: metallophosphoesterase [Thermoproteota archaeon]|nr:metallophosphoesterase [Thermoproteota archaeon]